jgi:lipid-binding SYLF domain-containing protein
MRKALTLCALAALTVGGVVGCETNSPNSPAAQASMANNSQTALAAMTAQDGKLQDLLNNSYGYVIFPEVGQAAIGVGGSSGHGTVFQNGKEVGTVKLTQVSLGPQVGGDTYSELIIFQSQQAMNRLMNDSLEFGAAANATAVKAGAAAAARFDNGVSVFILPKGGLMAGANINGQKFHFDGNGQTMDTNNTKTESTKTDVTNTPPAQTTTETKTTTNTPAPDAATH